MLSFRIGLLIFSSFFMLVESQAENISTDLKSSAKNDVLIDEARDHKVNTTSSTIKVKPDFAAVPFFFSSENLSTAFGGAGVIKHAGQVQASAMAIGLYTTNDSWVSYLNFNSYQLPNDLASNWLFGAEYYQAFYKEGVYYLPSADSAFNHSQRIITQGDESFTRLHIEYILPIANGANGAVASMIPSKQAINWNPLTSGVTKIKLTPFMQSQSLLNAHFEPTNTKGIELLLDWDNRDNGKNSSDGGQTSVKIRQGLAVNDAPSWMTWEFEQSAFFSIGDNDLFRQQIIAANFYLADTPSWSSRNAEHQYQRPPSYAGISLGGYQQLRGYSTKRFFDRSAVLYSLEYRVQPHWQPLQEWPIFNFYDVPWWQWVIFAEAGQISDRFSGSALHKDMKWSVGAGTRFEVESVVVRAELGVSQESNQFWVMISQPF